MRNNVKVSLLGKSFSLVTDQEPAIVEKAARKVDDMMRAKIEKMVQASEEKVALLVALELAADLMLSNQKLEQWQDSLERLSSVIDKNLESKN